MNSKERWEELKYEIIDRITDIYMDFKATNSDELDWFVEMVEICGILDGGDV